MDVATYLARLRRRWYLVAVFLLLGVVAAVAHLLFATKVWASTVTFYVGTPVGAGDSAFSSSQFAQGRTQTYAALLSSQRLGQAVAQSAGVDLSATQVSRRITAEVPVDTVLIDATVQDTSQSRVTAIASAVAADFGPLVDQLDNSGSRTVTVSVVSGPQTSTSPVSPRLVVDVAAGVLGGLALGALAAIWHRGDEHRDPAPTSRSRNGRSAGEAGRADRGSDGHDPAAYGGDRRRPVRPPEPAPGGAGAPDSPARARATASASGPRRREG